MLRRLVGLYEVGSVGVFFRFKNGYDFGMFPSVREVSPVEEVVKYTG
jgi:hypothetical protein